MTTTTPLHVACAANAAYALPMTVMLTSLVCHLETGRDVYFHIVESGIEGALREKVEASVLRNKKDSQRVVFEWIRLDPALVADLPASVDNPYLTSDMFSRLFLPDFLAPEIERVVYLDCDMVVLKDIALLNDALDPDHTIAAVPGIYYPYVSSVYNGKDTIVFNYADLGIPATNRYFNSGVLVMNLPRWRARDATAATVGYLKRHGNKVVLDDQGALNAILYDDWMRLDQRWNQTNIVLYPERWAPPAHSRAEWRRTRNDPFIVHFSSNDKPWKPGFNRPRASFFQRYLQRTLFRDEAAVSSLESRIGFRAYYLLWRAKKRLVALLTREE